MQKLKQINWGDWLTTLWCTEMRAHVENWTSWSAKSHKTKDVIYFDKYSISLCKLN